MQKQLFTIEPLENRLELHSGWCDKHWHWHFGWFYIRYETHWHCPGHH